MMATGHAHEVSSTEEDSSQHDDNTCSDDDHDDDSCSDDDPDLQFLNCRTTNKLTSPVQSRHHTMLRLRRGRRGMHAVNDNIHHDVWDSILCEGVPVSLREIVSLAAVQLKLQDTEQNHKRLLECSWNLGWHVTSTTSDKVATHYWGGGVTPNTTSAYLRGDWIEIHGNEDCRGVQTSRLARVICGVKIKNIKRVFNKTFERLGVWENKSSFKGDYVVYLLIRYAGAHPDTAQNRGPENRPLCPGELQYTHCLWKWYERPRNYRRGCWRPRPWERHKHLFGDTEEQQLLRKRKEARAWYDLIQVSNVRSHTNVQIDFDRPDTFLQSVMWC